MKPSNEIEQAREHIFELLAAITQAMASPTRLRIIQILASRPCTVEVLSQRTQESMANTSQHLQKLLKAGLLTCEKQGVSRIYQLANDKVLEVWLSLQSLATEISPELEREAAVVCPPELVAENSVREIKKMVKEGKALLVDVREADEFAATPVPNTLHIPLKEFSDSSRDLPKAKTIFVFCRGAYCSMANPAVELLRKRGYRAYRIRENSYQLQNH